jgi:hypothetical protein
MLSLSLEDVKGLIESLGYNLDDPYGKQRYEWAETFAKWQ